MIVRPRRQDDLDELVALLALTQGEVGYPVSVANVRRDWLAPADDLGAWVVERDAHPVAHVALHTARGPSVPLWRAATGRPREGLAVVSRLFSRARGAGTMLLTCAVGAARELGREPVLEVHRDSAAYDFYLRHGWATVGELEQRWGERAVTCAALRLTRGGDA